MQVHVARDGKQVGVFSVEEINQQLGTGTLRMSDQAWYEGAAGWAPLSMVPGVTGETAPAPAAATPASAEPTAPAPPTATPTSATPTAAVTVPQNRTEPLAIVSLVLSIAGLLGFCCGLLLFSAIAGIVCGHLALSRIKKDPTLQGHGLAMAGTVIGYVAFVGWLAWVVLFGGLAVLQGISESMMKR
jgi:Domain of unknown function (DUF4190)/GYF domain 2